MKSVRFLTFLLASLLAGFRLAAQAPVNDDLGNATVLVGTNATAVATTVGATAETGEPSHAGQPPAHSIWFVWTAPANGSAEISLLGSALGTDVSVYTGKYINALTPVSSNIFVNPNGAGYTGLTLLPVVGGTLYDIAVDTTNTPGSVMLSLVFTESYLPPQFSQQPSGVSVVAGNAAQLNVLATGDTPISYQWLFNGTNLPGATQPALGLTNVQTSQSGPYQAVASNPGGSVTSQVATLTVNVPPPNDDFTNRFTLAGNSASTTGSDVFASYEPGEPAHGGWSSGESVWWTWTAPTNGIAAVALTEFTGSQVLAVYTGSALNQLANVGVAGPSLAPPVAVSFPALAGTGYQIAVVGVESQLGTFFLDVSLTPTNFPPQILKQPVSQTVFQSSNVIFQVVAQSPLPLAYQWQYNGAPISGATNSTLEIDNVSSAQAGSYQVVIGNAGGSITSQAASLVVNVRPPNDNFANATPIRSLDYTYTGNNQFATSEPGEPFHAGYSPGASVWWSWTIPLVGEAYLAVTNFTGSETLAVYTGTNVAQLEVVASNTWVQRALFVHFAAAAGTTYQIVVADPYGGGGSFELQAALETSNFPPLILAPPPATTNVTEGGSITVPAQVGSDFPYTYQWYFDGAALGAGGAGGGGGGGGGGDGWGGGGAALQLTNATTNMEGCYQLVVSNLGGSVTSPPVCVTINLPPPNDDFTNRFYLAGTNASATGTTLYATLEPQEPIQNSVGGGGGSVWWSWTAPDDGTVLLTVTNTGSGLQNVEVYTGNALGQLSPVAGSSSAQNQISTTFVAKFGTAYQIAIAGGNEPVGLSLSILPANVPPQIWQQPADQTVAAGGAVTFQVGAIGGGVLSYHWLFNGAVLPGGDNSVLSFTGVNTNLIGGYAAVVCNPGGCVTSRVAALAVNLAPPNDDFTNSIALNGTNATVSESNQYATPEPPNEPSHGGFGEGYSVWYNWTAPSSGVVVATITNFTGNQVLAVYTGASLGQLTPVTNAPWFQIPFKVVFDVDPGVTCQIAVAGEDHVGGPFTLNWAFTPVVFPPKITNQPASQAVIQGQTATFRVGAMGQAPLAYQWQFNSTNLPGATNASLELAGTATNQAGGYDVVVTNPGGSVTSAPASLVVHPRPVNDDFANRIAITGGSVSVAGANVYATAELGEPSHDGYAATNSVWWSYTPPAFGIIQMSLSNSFFGAVLAVYTGDILSQLTLVASNAFGTSDNTASLSFLGIPGTNYQIAVQGESGYEFGAIHLSINGLFPPVIVSQPQDEPIAPGENAYFSVVAQSQLPLGYQWFFGPAAIAGATNQSLIIANASTNQAGAYSVVVSNQVGIVSSQPAQLSFTTVLKGQVTDAIDGQPLPGVPVWVGAITNITDTNGDYRLVGVSSDAIEAAFTADVRSGLAPLAVQFTDLSTAGTVALQAVTNGYYPYTNDQITIIPGQAVTNSFSMSPIVPKGTMRLVLNWGANPRDLDAHLTPPVIEGQTYEIYYQVGNRGDLTNYPFAALDHDATNGFGPETITIGEFFPGTYHFYVEKYAGVGSIACSGATVNIYTDAGVVQTLVAPATGVGDFWAVCDVDGATGAIIVLSQIQTNTPASLKSLEKPALAPLGRAAAGSAGPPPHASRLLASQISDWQWSFGDGGTSSLENPAHTYTSPGVYTVSLQVGVAGGGEATVVVTNYIQVFAPSNQPPTVSIVSPTNGAVLLSGTTAVVKATAAETNGTIANVFFFDNLTNQIGAFSTAPFSVLWLGITPGPHSLTAIATDASGLSVTSAPVIVVALSPPTILTEPQSRTVTNGVNVSFTVVAAGSPPLAYQWMFNSAPLPGQNGSSLTLSSVQTNLAGLYSVVVTNWAGTVTSSNAALAVLVPPSIIRQPINQTATNGMNVIFTTVATGTSPLGYQWLFNGTPLPGQNGTFLVLSSVQARQAGNYSVLVTNIAGSASSSNANLTVVVPVGSLEVAITSPANGAKFLAGAQILVAAAASEGNGTITQNALYINSTNLFGTAHGPGFSGVWTNAPAGAYTLTAVATDASGLSATSAPVSIVVTNALPPVILAVSIASPANNAAVCNGADIVINALVTNVQPVASVRFLAGSAFLGSLPGQSGQSSYMFDWLQSSAIPLAIGDYVLKAVVTDIQGNSATSAPVAVAVLAQCAQVAIVRAAAGPEIDALQFYLAQMGLSSQVFDQAGLKAADLSGFELVIWDDGGQTTNAPAPNTVDVLQQSYSNNIPLYLIGQHLASAAALLPPAQQSEWTNLTLLSAPAGLGVAGTAQITNLISLYSPILAASFGGVTNFDYAAGIELATNTQPQAEVFAVGGAADVLIAYPGPDFVQANFSGTNLFVQTVPVLPASPESAPDLEVLFENTVCWLLTCSACQALQFDLGYLLAPDTVQAGQVFTVALNVQNNSECASTGVVVTNALPPGVRFVSASALVGASSYDPVANQVVFNVGLLPRSVTVELDVTMVADQSGVLTNTVYGHQNSTAPSPPPAQAVITVLPSASPGLSLRFVAPGILQLSLTGQAGGNYEVDSSTDLLNWLFYTNVAGPGWSQLFPPSAGTVGQQFFRATTAP